MFPDRRNCGFFPGTARLQRPGVSVQHPVSDLAPGERLSLYSEAFAGEAARILLDLLGRRDVEFQSPEK
jgi:hypothetical protein